MSRQQLALTFNPEYRAAERWERLLGLFVALADQLGRKDVVYACGSDRNAFDDAIHERDRKSPRLKWLAVVLEMAADPEKPEARAVAVELVEQLAEAIGLEVHERKPLTPAEELDRWKRALAEEVGPAALERLRKRVHGGGRR
jgi:hypothetical protein